MSRIGRNASAHVFTAAIMSLLATAPGSVRAADAVSKDASPRVIDFSTCARPDYPKADLRAEHTGTVTLLFLVAPDGRVTDSKVAKSSGHESLDEAARTALATCRFAPVGEAAGAPAWSPVQYQWVIDGIGGAGAVAMSPRAQAQALAWAGRVLARYRYKPLAQAADASAPVFDRYLAALDPDRLLFTQADIDTMAPQRERLARSDDGSQLDAAFAMFDLMRTRRMAMLAWTGDAVRGPLSSGDRGGPGTQAVPTAWPASDAERQARWHRRVDEEARRLRKAGACARPAPATTPSPRSSRAATTSARRGPRHWAGAMRSRSS